MGVEAGVGGEGGGGREVGVLAVMRCSRAVWYRFPQGKHVRQSCIMQIPLGENDLDLEEEHARGRSHLENMSIFFFSCTSTFQLLDKPWSQMSSLLPPGSCLPFLSRIGFTQQPGY